MKILKLIQLTRKNLLSVSSLLNIVLKAIKKDETIFAAYDKAEMRKAKIMKVANSDFVHTSKSLFWPDIIMLAAVDLDLMQSVSVAIGVKDRQR